MPPTFLATLSTIQGLPFWDIETGYEGPTESGAMWDVCMLNGEKLPGASEVICIPRIRIDIPKKAHRDGGPTIDRGHDAARVDITTELFTPAHWERYQEILRPLWRRPGEPVPKVRRGIDIAHPACAMFGVTSIIIESPESPRRGSVPGSRIATLHCLQYIAPKDKPVAKKTDGSGRRATLAPHMANARTSVAPPPSVTGATAKKRPASIKGDQ
jgi:hypothetical protein